MFPNEAYEICIKPSAFIKVIQAPFLYTFESGSLYQIVGDNGSGKSTLLNQLSTAFNFPVYYQGHTMGLKENLSVKDNLNIRQCVFQSPLQPDEVLTDMGLPQLLNRAIETLSAGQKQMIGLAGALLSHTHLWLLDEPFAHLDESYRQQSSEMLSKHLHNNGIAIITGHKTCENFKHSHVISLYQFH